MSAKNPPAVAASHSGARLAPVLAAVAALFAVVVGTSRAHLFGDSPGLGGTALARTALDTLFYLAIVYVLAVGALIVWAFWPDERIRAAPLRRRSLFATMVVPLFFTFLMGLLLALRLRPAYTGRPFPAGFGPGGSPPPLPGAPTASAAGGGVDWPALGIVVLLLLLAGAAVWRHERRRRRGPARTRGWLLEQLEQAVDSGSEELLAEPDPRRAVIAAYAAMERSLALGGLPRRASEAPHEYLSRLLGELDLGAGPAARLTALYETAKFSRHPVAVAEREAALSALEAIRAALPPRREAQRALL